MGAAAGRASASRKRQDGMGSFGRIATFTPITRRPARGVFMTALSDSPPDRARRTGPASRLRGWLLHDLPTTSGLRLGPHAAPAAVEKKSPWWQVMCLTGVDYFSTLGYQPAIAALAAGFLSPLATLVVVLVTLFGALPVYRRVAVESPHGSGSIAMLARLLPGWRGKLFVLVLLGFAATDFMITMTLSAADATAHLIENPLLPQWLHGQNVLLTLVLLAGLAAVFLRGFREAIGLAVAVVALYLLLNVVVVVTTLGGIAAHPVALSSWWGAVWRSHGNPLMAGGFALVGFPQAAVGVSGFRAGGA